MGSATSIIKLSLQSNQYEQGLRGAKRQFEDFTASIGINMKKMTAFGLAAGAAASAINSLTSAISTAISDGTRMAKEMEGVRAAFKRLDQPGLLDNLREATHGTVNDLELMKQAVKFDNFNLSLEQMGTMLAFAQQQAKDTGQDVGYLVNSIVTGLGRKSLPILDNLGLSATEIRERMKETGDMTKAVADIIQERMAAAGGYVETASDRAAKATADLENAMTSLGETFVPLIGASDSLWNSIKIGAINALNTAVKPLIQALSEAGTLGQGARATAGFGNLGGNSKVDRMIGRLGNGKTAGAYSIYQQQLGEFDKYINNKRFQIAAYGGDNSSVAQSAKARLQTELDGALKMREEYVKRAQELHNKVPSPLETTTTTGGSGGKGGSGGGTTAPTYAADSIAAQSELVSELKKKFNESGEAVRNGMLPELVAAEAKLKLMKDEAALLKANAEGKLKGGNVDTTGLSRAGVTGIDMTIPTLANGISDKALESANKWRQAGDDSAAAWKKAASAVSLVGSAMSSIKDPALNIASTIGMAIANIAMAYSESLAKDKTNKSNIWYFIATAAAAMVSMATTISQIHSATGYAEGGIVKGNNSYSGDNVPIMANEGELVLTKAMQGNLASQLSGGAQNLQLDGVISGENIHIVHSRYLKRTGQGELVTWR